MRPTVPQSAVFLRSAFAVFSSDIRAVLLASFCFALLAGIVATFAQTKLDTAEDELASALGIEWQELRSRVQGDLQTLSLLSTEELMMKVETTPAQADPKTAEHIGIVYVMRAGPALTLLFVGLLIVFYVGRTYFFLLFTAERTPYTAAGALPSAVFGMAALGLWVGVRSFAWLPMIGPFVALYMFPRLSLAAVYYARGGIGIFTAARQSWARTRGLWFPVTLRLALLLLICLLTWWILLTFVSIVALFSVKLAALLGLFCFFLLTAFFTAGLTVLAR
jgi:hypothetical protein